MSDIAVIIPMYNFGDMTKDCISATIENAGMPIDIHVIDDCSLIPFSDDRVTVHRLSENMGYTGATNHGILKVWNDYKFIHFLNNDTIPRRDFIKILHDTLEKHSEIGIACSAREIKMDGKDMLEMYPVDLLTGWAIHIDESVLTGEEYIHCAWVPICSALARTEVVQQVGLLDRRMRNHCSDNDFCVRVGEMGWKTVLVPKSRVFHIHEVTTRTVKFSTGDDRGALLSKIRCDYRKNLLDNFPIDYNDKLRGELIFMQHGGKT